MTEVGDYRILGKLGEGTFSEVVKVRHKRTSKYFAMKRFKKHFNSVDEIETLREIQALRRLNHHPNIIQLEEVIFDGKYGILSLAFELMDNNLYESLSRKGSPPISEHHSKWVMWQIMKALDFVHSKGIFHRDIKPENILVRGDIHAVPMPFPNPNPDSPHHLTTSFPLIKLADFGSCRGIHSRLPYTEYIATRWYRSPECLLFDGVYTYKMDVWGVGCVFFELVTKIPLFPGDDELDQLHKIHHVFGSPSDRLLKQMVLGGNQLLFGGNISGTSATTANSTNPTAGAAGGVGGAGQKQKDIFKKTFSFPPSKGCGLKQAFPQHILYGLHKPNIKLPSNASSLRASDFPGLTEECLNLIELMLQYDPDCRPTARQCLKHPWLRECREIEMAEKQALGLTDSMPATSAGPQTSVKSPVSAVAKPPQLPTNLPSPSILSANSNNTGVGKQLQSNTKQQSNGLTTQQQQQQPVILKSSKISEQPALSAAKNVLQAVGAKRSKNNHEQAPKHGGIEGGVGGQSLVDGLKSMSVSNSQQPQQQMPPLSNGFTGNNSKMAKESSVVSMPPVSGNQMVTHHSAAAAAAVAKHKSLSGDLAPGKHSKQPGQSSTSSNTNAAAASGANAGSQTKRTQQPHSLQPISSNTHQQPQQQQKYVAESAAEKDKQQQSFLARKVSFDGNNNANNGTINPGTQGILDMLKNSNLGNTNTNPVMNKNAITTNNNNDGIDVEELSQKLRLKRTATPRKQIPMNGFSADDAITAKNTAVNAKAVE